jgi:4a-hydroxytetrahydrobiopterin dehydratase
MTILALTNRERLTELMALPKWSYDPDRQALYRQFIFEDFSHAFAMMTRIASLAEESDHHPEWTNVYNRLDIWLTTHDAGGVSARDIMMAKAIEGLLVTSAGS